MGRRTNGTNRAGAAIGVNRYTGKLMPRKKTSPPVAPDRLRKVKICLSPLL